MKTAIIIGAGCSAGLADALLDKDFLNNKRGPIARLPFLHFAIRQLYEKWDGKRDIGGIWGNRLETVWSRIDHNFDFPERSFDDSDKNNIIAMHMDLADKENNSKKYYYRYYLEHPLILSDGNATIEQMLFLFAGWEIRRLILDSYNIELSNGSRVKYEKLMDKLRADKQNTYFISFNYDTLIEQTLKWDCYYLGLGDWNQNNGKGYPIVKPHGSLNWLQLGNKRIGLNYKPYIQEEDIGFDKNGDFQQHSIIGLVDKKKEYSLAENPGVVKMLYQEGVKPQLEKIFNEVDRFIILGYSLPFGDNHIINILQKINEKRKSSNRYIREIKWVDWFNSDKKKKEFENKIKYYFPVGNHTKVHELYFNGIERWIDSKD